MTTRNASPKVLHERLRLAFFVCLARARPDLKIVGVNATNSAVTVLSGRVYLAQTLADVVGCLE